MRIRKWFEVAMLLAIVTLPRVAAAPAPGQPPSAEAIARLIRQLEAADSRERRQARANLEDFGGPVLPALRQAIAASTQVEVKRRLEDVVARIEKHLLKTEEKYWKDLDASRRGLKDRLVNIVARTPALSSQQRVSAVYLLTVGRPPTDEEVKRAQKQFLETKGRAATAVRLARSLVQGKEYCAAVADINLRLTKVQADLATEKDLNRKLLPLNSEKDLKLCKDLAAALNRVKKADDPLIDLAFLLVVSRFPTENEMKPARAHLKKAGRQGGTEDMVWALINSKDFRQPQ
jgi:hypothetical protein